MKRFLALSFSLACSGTLLAYGVSPSQSQGQSQGQYQQPQAPQGALMPNGNGGFQLQPAPQPSNNLVPGSGPAANPQPQIQVNNEQQIQDNIKNYKPDEWAKAWDHIHLEQAKEMANDPSVLFADARSKVEYDQGHIPGAIPLPVGEFDVYYKKYEAKIKKARKIVTYCHGVGCKLSDKCAQKLYNDHKFHNVASFFGGWPQWQQANLPIEVGPEPKKFN
jgi:rhodanese-related sulfurtransferase